MNENRKQLIISIIVILLIALFIVWLKRDQIAFFKSTPELILKAEVNLSQSDRVFVEKRLADNQAKLLELGENATVLEKVNINFMLSADYRLLGEYGKAKELLEQNMMLEPLNSNTKSTYSSLLAVMGDKEGALDYINQAIALFGGETNYWRWKIDLEKESGISEQKLEEIFKEALEKTDNNLNIVVIYAQFLSEIGKNDEAIKNWEKAIELYPENGFIYQAEIDRLKELL